jgi:hypothetical protein
MIFGVKPYVSWGKEFIEMIYYIVEGLIDQKIQDINNGSGLNMSFCLFPNLNYVYVILLYV